MEEQRNEWWLLDGNEGGLKPGLFKVFKHHQYVCESTTSVGRKIRREAAGFSPQTKVSSTAKDDSTLPPGNRGEYQWVTALTTNSPSAHSVNDSRKRSPLFLQNEGPVCSRCFSCPVRPPEPSLGRES